MDLAEGGGGFERGAVVELDLVGELEFLEEPEDALGAGLVQPGRGVRVGLAIGRRG